MERAPTATEPENPQPHFERLEGFWSASQAQAILDRTERFELNADVSELSDAEREVVARLEQVGDILQRLYEESRHPQALAVRAHLDAVQVDEAETD